MRPRWLVARIYAAVDRWRTTLALGARTYEEITDRAFRDTVRSTLFFCASRMAIFPDSSIMWTQITVAKTSSLADYRSRLARFWETSPSSDSSRVGLRASFWGQILPSQMTW